MALCPRNSGDPLLDFFLLTHKVNLLAIPRLGVELGSVFAVRADGVVENLPIAEVIVGTPVIEVADAAAEAVDHLEHVTSRDLDLKAGLSVLGHFLEAVGLHDLLPKVGAAYAKNSAEKVAYKIKECSVTRLRQYKLLESLQSCQLKSGHPYTDGKTSLYVCTGLWRAKGLEASVTDKNNRMINANTDIKGLAEGKAELAIKDAGLARTLFRSKQPLVFAVETMQLVAQESGLGIKNLSHMGRLRGDDGQPEAGELAVLGSEDGEAEAFIRIDIK